MSELMAVPMTIDRFASPLIAHWPANFRGEKSAGEKNTWVLPPTHLIDIMATCVDVAGAKYPQEFDNRKIDPMPGTSLLPLMNGTHLLYKTAKDRILFWEHEGNAAVREGDWKLVRIGRNGPWELYDMAKDRVELKNLARENAERVKSLSAKWETWAEQTHVMPYPG